MIGVTNEKGTIRDISLDAIMNVSDRSLMDEIREAGLSEAEAQNAIQAVYHYLESKYPVLATISRQVLIGNTSAGGESFMDFDS